MVLKLKFLHIIVLGPVKYFFPYSLESVFKPEILWSKIILSTAVSDCFRGDLLKQNTYQLRRITVNWMKAVFVAYFQSGIAEYLVI